MKKAKRKAIPIKPIRIETARMVINLPEPMKEALSDKADETGSTLTWIVTRLVAKYLRNEVAL